MRFHQSVFFISIFALAVLSDTLRTSSTAQGDPADESGLVKKVAKLESRIDLLSHEFGVGTVIFTMNDTPPNENWVPCDGEATFPSEKQVPESLRGKKVPKMQDAVVAVGNSAPGTRIDGSLSAQPVSGETFTLPKTTPKRMHDGLGNSTRAEWRGGFVGKFEANGDYLDVKFNTAHWGCFGGTMYALPATYEYHPEATKLQGKVNIAPPTHVYLRAYVRFR